MNFLATWFEEERTQHVILKIATQLFLISGYRCMESKHTIPLAARCADSVFCSSMCIFLCFLQRKHRLCFLWSQTCMPICHCALVQNLLCSGENCPEVLVQKLTEGGEWGEGFFSSCSPSLRTICSEVS